MPKKRPAIDTVQKLIGDTAAQVQGEAQLNKLHLLQQMLDGMAEVCTEVTQAWQRHTILGMYASLNIMCNPTDCQKKSTNLKRCSRESAQRVHG